MLKSLTYEQAQYLDRIVVKLSKATEPERKTLFTVMEATMGQYLGKGHDIGGYLGVYKALSRLYDGQVKAQQS